MKTMFDCGNACAGYVKKQVVYIAGDAEETDMLILAYAIHAGEKIIECGEELTAPAEEGRYLLVEYARNNTHLCYDFIKY